MPKCIWLVRLMVVIYQLISFRLRKLLSNEPKLYCSACAIATNRAYRRRLRRAAGKMTRYPRHKTEAKVSFCPGTIFPQLQFSTPLSYTIVAKNAAIRRVFATKNSPKSCFCGQGSAPDNTGRVKLTHTPI